MLFSASPRLLISHLSRAKRCCQLPSQTTRNSSASRNSRRRVTSRAQTQQMDAQTESLVRHIHATPTKAVFYITGGAATSLSWLLSVPGASSTVLEAVVPYAAASSDQLLKGESTSSYSGKEQAVRLAEAAYQRASELTNVGEWDFIGVAAACALATNYIKKGEHRCSIAIHSSKGIVSYTIDFEKGARTRFQEELVASRLVLTALAAATGVIKEADVKNSMQSLLLSSERAALEVDQTQFGNPISALLGGSIRCVEFCGSHFVLDAPRRGVLLLPGAFNPLHEGHLSMMKTAEKETGKTGLFELAVLNTDKGHISEDEIHKRLRSFSENNVPVLLTRATLFPHKADLCRGCTFVVGYDTAVRVVHPKYYGDSSANMMVELASIQHHGCRFLVAGRLVSREGEKRFLKLEDIQIPPAIKGMFQDLKDFRLDISSTEIRARLASKNT